MTREAGVDSVFGQIERRRWSLRNKVQGLLLLVLGLGVLIGLLLPAGVLVFIMGIAAAAMGFLICRRC